MTTRAFAGKLVLVMGAIFLVDCINPWGWPFSLCYVACLLWAEQRNRELPIYWLAGISTALVAIGGLESVSELSAAVAAPQRIFGVLLCWIVVVFRNRGASSPQTASLASVEPDSNRVEAIVNEATRETELRFRDYVDYAGDAVFLFNHLGVVLDVNRQACDSLGRAREDLIGSRPPFFAKIPSSDFLNNIIETLNKGQKVSFNSIHLHKESGEFPVEVRICPFLYNGQKTALGIARNITERKKFEEDLQHSERKFRELADAIPQIVWISGPDFQIEHFNARAAEYAGISREELTGQLWERCIHPDDLAGVRSRMIQAMMTGVTEDAEVRLRRHDGQYRWHICRQFASRNADGRIERWYGTCTDIESQKQIEVALRDSEQRFVGFMRHFPGFAWIKDLDGRYVFANVAFDQVVRGRHSNVVGLTDRELFNPQSVADFLAGDRKAIESCSAVHEFQTVKLNDEIKRLYFVAKFPILDSAGKPVLVAGMATDITDQKQAEIRIAGQNRIMEQIATGSSLGEILELIVEFIEDQIPNSVSSVVLYDARENCLHFGAGSSVPREYVCALEGAIVAPEAGSCGAAIHRRESIIVPDIMTSPLWKDLRHYAEAQGYRSCCSVPIFSRPREDDRDDHRRVLGTFAIYRFDRWEPNEVELQLIATATYLASVAIEREADERSLKESEQRYRALVDHAPVGIYVNVDNTFAYVNDATRRLMGADSADQLIGTSTLDRFPAETVEIIRSRLDRLLKQGQSVPWLKHRYLRLDGTEVDVESIGIPIQFDNRTAVQVLINDISDRKIAEEKLNATVKRLEMLYRASPVGICISTMENGIVLEANEIYSSMAGFENHEVIGRKTIDIGQWPEPAERDVLITELKRHGSVKNWEVNFRRKDGSIGCSLRSFERLELDGKDCILTTVSDISAKKEIDEELRVSRQRLEVLSRQLITTQETERRHLARELHDEIGQILTAIKINLSRTQKNADPDLQSSLEDHVALVEQAIGQVRDLSLSLRPPQLDQLGLVAALHWLVKQQARVGGFEENLDADIGELRISDDVAIVCFRVTQEALTNAVRHAHPRHVQVRLKVVPNELQLQIIDDGVGFNVAQARQRATGGASLGLLSMQERVNLAGGRLEIQSSIGKGTLVEARFPTESALVLESQI